MTTLRKIAVGPGVFWVDAPEAGWSILCGCPGDIVKILKQQGLIADQMVGGRHAETGPNAILLSDVMLQNGAFCNLAEFPVLQMLYRQGMILPGHPNNVGQRPVLIGNAQQVEAQLHYIHRGNYGLLDEDELLATGIDRDLAKEILAYKKRFAFGHIKHPSDLLECKILGDQTMKLRGGLTLVRLDLNLFEFRLGDQSVQVDLTLPAGQIYESPYRLPANRAPRDYFSIVHDGDGNGWDPDRPSMSSVICFQGRIYLIDAGPNIHVTLDALGIGVNEVVGMFHTHCHDDHFAGLTTLLRADHRLKYFATPLVRASVTKKLSALMGIDETVFADCFEIHDLEFDKWNEIGGFDVLPLLSPHPVETSVLLFRALAEGGYCSYAHWADVVASEVLHGMIAKPGGEGISQAFYDRVIKDYARPADLKKVDIGGGLIHGMAVDFKNDRSGTMLLSHLDRPLNEEEQKIGGPSEFGTHHVLIEAQQDYQRRDAAEYLHDYFHGAQRGELVSLLNCPIRTVEPGAALLELGEPIRNLYLILSGTVERVIAGGAVGGGFTAGSLIGEVAGLDDRPASYTYRCRSHVSCLVIPLGMMREFLQRNGLQDLLLQRAEARAFLRSTQICAVPLCETTLTHLARAMTRRPLTAGEWIDVGDSLALVAKGSVQIVAGSQTVETLPVCSVFNEERAMFAMPQRWKVRAEQDGEIALLESRVIRQVPLLRWTLLEIFERRRAATLLPSQRRKRSI